MSARTPEYQRRYRAFLAACGLPEDTPQEQLPSSYRGYIYLIWINRQWREFEHQTGNKPPHNQYVHDEFDTWLANRVGQKEKEL